MAAAATTHTRLNSTAVTMLLLQALGLVLLAASPTLAAAVPGSVATNAIPTGVVPLATFDGSSAGDSWKWRVVNDPVMGGVSSSTFNISDSALVWQGQVRIVPSLKAPGFCNLETQGFGKAPASAAGTTHLLLRVRTTTPGYYGFKVSFSALTVDPQFASFKANFNVTVGGAWTTVAVPFTEFSNNWSPYTGDCSTKDPTGVQHVCCSAEHPEVCPTQADLANVQALGLWTEGTAGAFTLDVAWVGAGNVTSPQGNGAPAIVDPTVAAAGAEGTVTPPMNPACSKPIMPNLRYNNSNRLASHYLPYPFPMGTTIPQAICCDPYFESFAEPKDWYKQPFIDLFGHLNVSTNGQGVTTFFDSACGIPLFRAPVGRTLAAFRADTAEHGWPSFRNGEVVTSNLVTMPDGNVFSNCGTHVGTYFPDATGGPRYCIDLSCISGRPTAAQ